MTLSNPLTLTRKKPISSVLSRKRDRWRKNTAQIIRQEQAVSQARPGTSNQIILHRRTR